MAKNKKARKSSRTHSVKKCPECFVYLPLHEKRCPSCKTKLADVDQKTGIAKKPVDWKAYFMCLASMALLAFFVWWFLLKDK